MLHLHSVARGTGKTFLGEVVKDIFGPMHGTYVTDARHLVGNFNAHIAQTGLLFLDEAVFPGYREHQNKLKALITQSHLMLEMKGVDPVQIRNALKIMAASNERWLAVAAGDERRHAMFEVGEHRKQDRAYFGAIWRQLYQEGGLGRFLYDLRRRDIEGWHPESNIPTTALLVDNKRLSADPEVKWFASILNEGVLPRSKDLNARVVPAFKAQATALYDHGRARGLARWSDFEFSDFLKNWGIRKRESVGSVWHFSPLPELRKLWVKKYPYWAFDPAIPEWVDTSGDDDTGPDDDDDDFN